MQGRTKLVTLALVVVFSATGAAQNVRGIVREQNSGMPLSGVLMTLLADTTGSPPVASSLTNDLGAYALQAPAPGRFRVSAKRIGVRRFLSEEIQLAAPQQLELDVGLEALVFQLPAVRVEQNTLCARRDDQAHRLASLWDEARTALTATQISLRDRLFRGRVVRYVRELDPRSLEVRAERSRQQRDGVVERPFVSLSGDSLSRAGYWQVLPRDSVSYHAPDADVLLSSAFVRDHCFTIAQGRGERAGLTGMAFEPVSGRKKPDVRGTIWLDAKSWELRLVEFRYTELPVATTNRHIGGEVHFARLAGGAWVVERWFIRMPRYASRPTTRSSGVPGQRPVVAYQVTSLIEEGGTVTAEAARPGQPPRD